MKQIKKYGRKVLMLYWAVFKPLSLGARIMVIYKNKVLLVRHTYIDGYFLPGGGAKKEELFEVTARRELKEEVGIEVDSLELFGIYQSTKERKYTTNVVFITELTTEPKIIIQYDELVEAKFFNLKNLPNTISPGTKRRIQEYRSGIFPVSKEW